MSVPTIGDWDQLSHCAETIGYSPQQVDPLKMMELIRLIPGGPGNGVDISFKERDEDLQQQIRSWSEKAKWWVALKRAGYSPSSSGEVGDTCGSPSKKRAKSFGIFSQMVKNEKVNSPSNLADGFSIC
jgi:hypothetical protein